MDFGWLRVLGRGFPATTIRGGKAVQGGVDRFVFDFKLSLLIFNKNKQTDINLL